MSLRIAPPRPFSFLCSIPLMWPLLFTVLGIVIQVPYLLAYSLCLQITDEMWLLRTSHIQSSIINNRISPEMDPIPPHLHWYFRNRCQEQRRKLAITGDLIIHPQGYFLLGMCHSAASELFSEDTSQTCTSKSCFTRHNSKGSLCCWYLRGFMFKTHNEMCLFMCI